MSMHPDKVQNASFLILLAVVSILLFFVFSPFLTILALAAVSAILLHRPYERLTTLLGGWKSGAAVVTLGLMLIFIIAPLLVLGWEIYRESLDLVANFNTPGTNFAQTIEQSINTPIQHYFPGVTFSIETLIGNSFAYISENLGSLVFQTVYVVSEILMMMLALFFFLRDGRTMTKTAVATSPLGEEITQSILDKTYASISAVMKGTLINAVIRLAAISLAFYLFGIPNPVLWGSIGGVIGTIPGLGTPFAFIPAIIYLYLQGNIVGMIGLTVLGLLILLIVDNMLTVHFFNRGLGVSPIFVLFSLFGGIIFFGPLGFVLGPLVLSVFLSVVRVYNPATQTS